MYKTIIYVDGFKVKRLRLEQDYIDFKMREEFDSWQDFIVDELEGWSYSLTRGGNADSIPVVICRRPFVMRIYNRAELLMRFVDYEESGQAYLDGGLSSDFRLKHQNYQAYDLYRSMESKCKEVAKRLQNKGLKTVLKKVNSNHLFTMVNQLLTDKIEEHATN